MPIHPAPDLYLLGAMHFADDGAVPPDVWTAGPAVGALARLLESLPMVVTRLNAAVIHQHESRGNGPDHAIQTPTAAARGMLAHFGALHLDMIRTRPSASDGIVEPRP